MTRDTPDDENRTSTNMNRRTALGALGASLLATGTGFGIGGAGATDGSARELGEFRVTGTIVTRATIRPTAVTITKRKTSSELKERYGKSEVVEERTIERPDPEADDLPEKAKREERRDWDALYATGDEWETLFETQQETLMFTDDGVSADASYPSYVPKYYHAQDSGGYELKGPVNLLSNSTANANDLAVEIDSEGGILWNTWPVEYGRHMYIDGEWIENEASVASGPFGVLGRTHGRIWTGPYSNYGIVGAHIDDSAPHEATSYLDAEQEITGMMNGNSDYYDADNGEHPSTGNSLLDHNGDVSLI
ncbi:hypothetical protein [Natrialba sp. PRR66]|uniref:hypothetical protein n=1 Tax=Natrialba sp. PRR66 TaxID=3098146 RepID=UPI002B1E358E|nr:hypothetical protein [Natrialba sp. PRR66]